MLPSFCLYAAAALLAPAASALPMVYALGSIHPTKVITQDFADPSLLQDGSQWWAFATNNHKTLGNPAAKNSDRLINVQVAHSSDFNSWSLVNTDAMPVVAPWVDSNARVWAPKVMQNAQGKYVMYYSAAAKSNPDRHCVGVALSDTPSGIYTPLPTPFVCDIEQGGAIDASAFKDVDGSNYVVYKVEGNNLGTGGFCGNSIAPIHPTPLMLQRVDSDGYTPIGTPTQILDRSELDGPLIEGPALMRTPGGKYVLFFSSNCFRSSLYDVSYAYADSITGPYTKGGPMAITGTAGLFAPGGADMAQDGVHMAFHDGDAGPENGWRSMWTAKISVDEKNMIVNS